MRSSFYIFLVVLALFSLVRVYYNLTDDIRIGNMVYEMPYRSDWAIDPITENERSALASLFSQTFTYIGKGSQSYAFQSDDNKYVLKFFKFKHLRPNAFVDSFPDISPFREYKARSIARKERKLFGVFEGYRLAFAKHRKESGLIHVHLNVDEENFGTVKLKDKLGFTRELPLGSMIWVLQERARTTRDVLFDDCQRGDLECAKRHIRSLFDLYQQEYAKGIIDHDHGVTHNTGFVEERAIHLDIGKLHDEPGIQDPKMHEVDLIWIGRKLDDWFASHLPQFRDEMQAFLLNELSFRFGHSVLSL